MAGKTSSALARAQRAHGFTLIELMTVLALLGILIALAFPSMTRFMDREETKKSVTQMAGVLTDARARAMAEGTPHLVYFNPPSVDGNGSCGATAVEVRDADHSYSITPGDTTREIHLDDAACTTVQPYGEANSSGEGSSGSSTAQIPVPLPADDLATRANGTVVSAVANTVAGLAGSVGSTVSAVTSGGGSGSSSSGSGEDSGSGSSEGEGPASGNGETGATTANSARSVSDSVVNGATFPIDAESGRPVIAFSERGIPVDPAQPTAWGGGAGGLYLTDGHASVYAAIVQPLGEVQMRMFDVASGTWK
jgi:prepilin-type N-terminal cleavage/methylation domain-containing protein